MLVAEVQVPPLLKTGVRKSGASSTSIEYWSGSPKGPEEAFHWSVWTHEEAQTAFGWVMSTGVVGGGAMRKSSVDDQTEYAPVCMLSTAITLQYQVFPVGKYTDRLVADV